MLFVVRDFLSFNLRQGRPVSHFPWWSIFHGGRGMYLNKWTLEVSPENDIAYAIPIWVHLPFLLLHCCNDETLHNIGNVLGNFIDQTKPHEGIQACARIFVEVDLEKGSPKDIQLTLDKWTYLQEVDYEKLPFKYKACHEYGHFAKKFPHNKSYPPEERVQEQWKQRKRKKET
jgi:hypothetical protein